MSIQTEISEDEVVEVLKLLESLNSFFHEPMKYENSELTISFAQSIYPQINKAYYETVWNWLSEARKTEYMDRFD